MPLRRPCCLWHYCIDANVQALQYSSKAMAADPVIAEVGHLVPVAPAEWGTNQAGQEQEDTHQAPKR
jgi:hypothetical protein